MDTMQFLSTVLIIFTVTTFANSVALKNVTISKCCDSLERYSKDVQKCINGTYLENWTPKIYSPRKKKLIGPGIVPSNWHIKPSRPMCRDGTLTFLSLDPRRTTYMAFENGSLWLLEYDKLVRLDKYCLDYNVALVCKEEVQEPEIMVKKCCGEGAIYKDTKQSCVTMKGADYRIILEKGKTLKAGWPSCEDGQMVIAGKFHEAKLQENGSLLVEEANVLLPSGQFCLEHVLENAGPSASIFTCQRFLPPSVTSHPSHEGEFDLRFTLYPIGLALSAIFLAATLAAGSLLPASHHVLHWRCQTNHVVCLLVGYILLCITQVAGRNIYPTPCFIIAVAMHFLFLAAFFWLNTMCFNIWWTFRDLRPQSMEKSQERCRLRLYQVYAWGGPLLIAGTAAILDTIPDTSEYAFLRPRFGTSNCWFHGDLEILTYFYGPVGALLLINLALFLMTARELTCGLWKRELVKSTTERAALGRVCMKLVVVMGVTWIADVISWAVGGPQEIWYLTDLINCLQGVLIFIVVGCQPQVLTAVKRWWCWRKRHTTGTAGTTNHHSSSSQGLPSMGDTVTNNSITNNTTKSIPMETSC